MPQPYNYTVGQPPAVSFLQGLAESQQINQQTQLQQRAAQMHQDLIALEQHPTDSAFGQFYAKYPEMQKNLEAWQKSLSEQDQNTAKQALTEALVLQKAGKGDQVGQVFQKYAEAAQNSGRPDLAQQFQQAEKTYNIDPQKGGPFMLKMFYNQVDPEGYKNLFPQATTFQQDFGFIRDTFGPKAAAEYAQYGRDGSPVSIPLGPGKTWVGPASMAPGQVPWQEQSDQPAPQGQPMTDNGAASILQKASAAKKINQVEAEAVRKSLGPNGQQKFEEWLTKNNIKVVVRTGTDASGKRVEQYSDGSIGYAD